MQTIELDHQPVKTLASPRVQVQYADLINPGKSMGSNFVFEVDLPEWFDRALAECREGKVVDMDVALRDSPPRA